MIACTYGCGHESEDERDHYAHVIDEHGDEMWSGGRHGQALADYGPGL